MINHVMFIKCYERSTKGKGKNALDITTGGRALCEEEEEEEEEDWDDTNMTGLPNLVRKVGSSDFTSQNLFLLLRPFILFPFSRDDNIHPKGLYDAPVHDTSSVCTKHAAPVRHQRHGRVDIN